MKFLATPLQTITTCTDGLACCKHVHNKSCVSCFWNLENDTTNGEVENGILLVTRMLRENCFRGI